MWINHKISPSNCRIFLAGCQRLKKCVSQGDIILGALNLDREIKFRLPHIPLRSMAALGSQPASVAIQTALMPEMAAIARGVRFYQRAGLSAVIT